MRSLRIGSRTDGPDSRVGEYWDWFSVSLFLLTTVDLLTTLYAVHRFGLGAEANPLVRWLLRHHVVALVAANLLVVVIVVLLFDRLLRRYRSTPPTARPALGLTIELWLGFLVVCGLAVFANNLAVIVFGESLLAT